MLSFELDGSLVPLTVSGPAFVPLLKLPPRRSAPVWPVPLFHVHLPSGPPEKIDVLLPSGLWNAARGNPCRLGLGREIAHRDPQEPAALGRVLEEGLAERAGRDEDDRPRMLQLEAK